MTENPEQITCMEVWGGNEPTEQNVSLAGLDAWVYSLPFGQAQGGGDVYYVSSCATGRITRLLVADVSGHGSAVAELAQGLRTLMRKYVNHLQQTRFVQSMNAQFAKISKDGCFATALVTTFFSPTGELSLCNAGHPPPLRYRAKEKRWEFLEAADDAPETPRRQSNVPLGILDIVDYEQFMVTLEKGDLVLCYTDSLIEARDTSGKMLGRDGLIEIVRTLDTTDPKILVPTLVERIDQLSPGKPWDDDVTAMLFQPSGYQEATLATKLLAPLRVCKSFFQGIAALPDLSLANIGGAMFGPLNRLGRRRT